MGMSSVILAIILIVAILAIAYFLVKKFTVLLINAVLGLIFLFVLNTLQVMQWIGKPDLGYSLATIIICGIGGLPGVLVLVLLNMIGITV
jgi:inhibitor of the pro-sigma K processing machinery